MQRSPGAYLEAAVRAFCTALAVAPTTYKSTVLFKNPFSSSLNANKISQAVVQMLLLVAWPSNLAERASCALCALSQLHICSVWSTKGMVLTCCFVCLFAYWFMFLISLGNHKHKGGIQAAWVMFPFKHFHLEPSLLSEPSQIWFLFLHSLWSGSRVWCEKWHKWLPEEGVGHCAGGKAGNLLLCTCWGERFHFFYHNKDQLLFRIRWLS